MADFYDSFFEQGWPYFYRFSLSMLGIFKDKLLEEDEFAGILSHIKFKTPEKHHGELSAYTSAAKDSPKKTSVFIFDESTNSFTKQNIV